MKECPECNAENPIAASFCRHCRYKFDKISKGGKKINPEIKDFRTTELYAVEGVPFDIVWEVENCTRLLLNGIEIPTNLGKKRETISKTTTFTLTAENEYQVAEKTIVITPLSKPVIKSFQTSRIKIKNGDKIRLSWKTENADEIVIQHNNVLIDVSSKEELEVTPTENTTYKLTVYLIGGICPVEKELTILVYDKIEIISFTSDKSKILESEKVILSWDVKNATRVILQPLNKILSENGTFELWPRVDANYYIEAENDFFSERKDVFVFATPLPRISIDILPLISTQNLELPNTVLPLFHDFEIIEWIENLGNFEKRESLISILSRRFDKMYKQVIDYAKVKI